MTERRPPCFDVWVCQGRMCTSFGSDDLFAEVGLALRARAPADQARVRLLRGGCFGLCELSANVVVRRYATPASLPDPEVDRLRITARKNETVYSRTTKARALAVLESHLDRDEPADEYTLERVSEEVPPETPTAKNIRRIRRARAGRVP